MGTATVTGQVLGTPNEAMRAQPGGGEPELFTPWMTAREAKIPAAPQDHQLLTEQGSEPLAD